MAGPGRADEVRTPQLRLGRQHPLEMPPLAGVAAGTVQREDVSLTGVSLTNAGRGHDFLSSSTSRSCIEPWIGVVAAGTAQLGSCGGSPERLSLQAASPSCAA